MSKIEKIAKVKTKNSNECFITFASSNKRKNYEEKIYIYERARCLEVKSGGSCNLVPLSTVFSYSVIASR